MFRFDSFVGILIVWLMVCLSACSGNSSVVGTTEDQATLSEGIQESGVSPDEDSGIQLNTGPVSLPAFPPGTTNPSQDREVSVGTFSVLGDQVIESAGELNYPVPDEDSYVIIPGPADRFAWAMYCKANLTADRPVEFEVRVEAAVPEEGGDEFQSQYWVGLADYTQFIWEWFGPYTESEEMNINNEDLKDRFVDEVGSMYWVVVVDGEPAGVNGIKVTEGLVYTDPEYLINKPHYAPIEDLEIGVEAKHAKSTSALAPEQYVRITWEHIPSFGTHDDANAADYYRVYRRGPTDLIPIELNSLFAPNIYFVDPVDSLAHNPEPNPGSTYRYYLRAKNDSGWTPFSVPFIASIPMYPPDNVAAALDESAEYIEITWDEIEGVNGYSIHRSLSGEGNFQEIASVLAGTARFEDTTAVPGVYYDYYVCSIGEGERWIEDDDFPSSPSEITQGLRSVILTLTCIEDPAPTGAGAVDAPYILINGTDYQFGASDQDGNDLTDQVSWVVDPPALARFDDSTDGLLTDIWEHAGNFRIETELYLDISYSWVGETYCRVEMEQP